MVVITPREKHPVTRKTGLQFDEIGYWSEIKLDIVKEYAQAYSQILTTRKNPSLYHIYVDAFAGPGQHVSRQTGALVPGSPLNALHTEPPFREYHFIELAAEKAQALRDIARERPNVYVYEGDCNMILLDKVFPKAQYKDFRRALVLLDPYGLHLNWEVIQTAGQMRSVDVFLNFPVMDMNRNVLWRNPENVDEGNVARMNAFWGDKSWQEAAYQSQPTLFGTAVPRKTGNGGIVRAFRTRLSDVAGFKRVPEPIPMRNTLGGTLYYLFFASQQPVAEHIVKDIFKRHRNKGVR